MSIKLAGIQLGSYSGPVSITLEDLADVYVSGRQTGQYLRYNAGVLGWQNNFIDADVFSYLNANMTGSNGIGITYQTGPNTINIGVSVSLSGDATGTLTNGNIPLTLSSVNATPGTFGSSSAIPQVTVDATGRITSVTSVPLGTPTQATNLSGGNTGYIPYQSAPNTTTFLSAGTSNQVLVSGTSPSWTNTPTLTGTNFSGIPNNSLLYSSITIGSTNISLGSTSTTLSGLTSVSSTSFTGALSGNASTASQLSTGRNITATGDASWTVLFDGSSDVSAGLTLATVNSSPVTNLLQKITTNAKGLVTATSSVGTSDITTALGYTPVNRAGDTMTGALILNADPTAALGAATKQYVDNVASGVNIHAACETGSTAPLPSCNYNNGTGGVGATLTATANGSINTPGIGGYTTMVIGTRVLIKDQANQIQNGIYNVNQVGDGSNPWILIRATDFDGSPTNEVEAGDLTYIQEGTLAGTQWVQTNIGTGHNAGPPTYDYVIVGTDNIIFSQFSGAGTYTAGTGIQISSNIISNTGVTSIVAGTNISVSSATGAVTVNVSGTVPTATTATNIAGGAAGSVPYQSSANTTGFISGGTSGYVLTSNGPSVAPTWQAVAATFNGGTITNPLTISTATTPQLSLGTTTADGVINSVQGTQNNAGGLTLASGGSTVGNANPFAITGGNGGVSGGIGGNGAAINITSGTGGNGASTGGAGGAISIQGGFGGTGGGTGVSGSVTIQSGGAASGINGGFVLISSGDSSSTSSSYKPGSITLRGGDATSGSFSGNLNDLTIRGGNTAGTGLGGNVTISGGTSGTAANGGTLVFSTAGTERLRILANGAWSVGTGGTATGTSGQALISNGSGSAPTWQSVTTSPSGSDTQIQYNNSGAFGASPRFTWTDANNRLEFGDASSTSVTLRAFAQTLTNGTSQSLNITGSSNSAAAGTSNGGDVNITAGFSLSGFGTGGGVYIQSGYGQSGGSASSGPVQLTTGAGSASSGSILISSGTGYTASGSVTISSGITTNTSTGAGTVTVRGADQTNTAFAGGPVVIRGGAGGPTGGAGGQLTLSGGAGSASSTGGNVVITGGLVSSPTSGTGGYITVQTGTSSLTERLRITAAGDWQIGGSSGTSGQALVSNGTGSAPTWQSVSSSPGGSTTQIQYNNSGVFAGSAGLTWTDASNRIEFGTAASSSVTIRAFAQTNNSGSTQSLNITGSTNNGSGASAAGGDVNINGGQITGNGNGGNVNIYGGYAPGTGAYTGGGIYLQGGSTGGGSAVGGLISILSGAPGGANSGTVTIASGGGYSASGTVTITSGQTTNSGTPGTVTVKGGDQVSASLLSGGLLTLRGGNGGQSSGVATTGGNATLSAGSGNAGGNGGNVTISGGTVNAATTGVGGYVAFQTGTSSLSERMRIDVNGNVGIGVSNPNGARLAITGGALASTPVGVYSVYTSSALTTGRTGTYQAGTLSSIHTYYDDSSLEFIAGSSAGNYAGISASGNNASLFTSTVRVFTVGAERMRVDPSGNVLIGTTTPTTLLTVNGTVTATAFNATSTKRVKKAIKNLGKEYINKFGLLKPREYDRKDSNTHEFGFVAEEMALIYPEVVGFDNNGKPASIDYSRLSTLLIAKVQEQQSVIDELKKQVSHIVELLRGDKK